MLTRGHEREIRVFISSPSDVGAERASAVFVLQELSVQFEGRFRLVPLRWEDSYYSAHQTFQDAIPKPSSCDLVVCILWKRLGTDLPARYSRPDGMPRTGTEYEFEEALDAAVRHGVPDIFVYRKQVLIDADRIAQEASELRALNAFWHRWFSDEQGNLTASFDRFTTDDEFHKKLKRDVHLWLDRQSQNVTWPIEQLGSPFRSLEPFDTSHARVFFGRRRAIRRAVAKLAAAAARGCPFLVVLGGSGSGKSSIARAGIISYLTLEPGIPGVAVWRVMTVRPASLSEDLFRGLSDALFQPTALPELCFGEASDPQQLAILMRTKPEDASKAITSAVQRLAGPHGTARLVLVIDQLEELLLRPADTREALIAALDALVRGGQVWVIATLRNDRYSDFQTSSRLVRLKAEGDSFDLPMPGPDEVREIIEGPARAAGLRFEETAERSLASLLAAAAQEPGALPLLQFTLQSLFIERDSANGMLLLSVYDRLGGLAGAIAGEAERVVADLSEAVASQLPGLLLNLVEIEDGEEDANARALDQAALVDPMQRALAARMIEGRLLTIDGLGEATRLRLAHEALLIRWPRFAEIIRVHRDFLGVRRRVEADVAAWIAHDRQPDFLLPAGLRLVEAADALAGHRAKLGETTIAFVEMSLAAERERIAADAAAKHRELELRAEMAESRTKAAARLFKLTRAAVVTISLLMLAMASVALLWLDQREIARRRAAEAEQNYTTALKVASKNLEIVQRAAAAGRVTFQVKRALLKITREAFENLPSERESPEAVEVRTRLLISLETANDNSSVELGRKAIELGRKLVARDAANAEWQGLLQEAHWQLGSGLVIAGDLAEAATQFAAAEAISLRFVAAHPDDPAWRLRLAVNRKATAEIMRRRGDLEGALTRYRASDDRVGEGDVLLARGEHVAAAAAYRANLNAKRERAKRTGTNANMDTALALAHEKVGNLLWVEGDLDGAMAEYGASVKLCRALFQNMFGSFGAARTLYTASRGIADVALIKGDAANALAQYQAIAAEVSKRVDVAPKTPEWRAELAEIDERIGDVRLVQGDFVAAESRYRSELASVTTLTQMGADDADWQRDIELAHGRLAEALRGKGDLDGAATEYTAQIDLANRLTLIDPTNANWQRDLALGWAGLGVVLERRREKQSAAKAFDYCLKIPVKTRADPRDELPRDPRGLCQTRGSP